MNDFFHDLMVVFLAGVYSLSVDLTATTITVKKGDGEELVLQGNTARRTTVWDEVGEQLFVPWFRQKMSAFGLRMLVDEHTGMDTIRMGSQVRLVRSGEIIHDSDSGHLSAPKAVAALYFVAGQRGMLNQFPEFTP